MPNRRDMLRAGTASFAFPLLGIVEVGCSPNPDGTRINIGENTAGESNVALVEIELGAVMKVQYLEIVSPDVDTLCKTYSQVYGLQFGKPDASLGNARTADLPNGAMLGIRAPLRSNEQPIVRPYFLVDDVEAAVSTAAESGAQVALPPMPLPGHGICAIVIQGGVEHGLWQMQGSQT